MSTDTTTTTGTTAGTGTTPGTGTGHAGGTGRAGTARAGGDRALALAGGAFLVLLLLGNTLALSGVEEVASPTDAQLQASLVLQAEGTLNQIGVALELLAFAALAVLVGRLAHLLRPTPWGAVAAVAGATVLGVKLASAAPFVVARAGAETLEPALLRALVDMNDVAFVVSWLPYAVFVGALAVGARQAGLTGAVLARTGVALAALGLVAAVLGLREPASALPVPFLLSLLWTVALSVRLGRGCAVPAGPAVPAPAPARV